MKLKLTRDVTINECDWLDRDFKEGEEAFSFGGCTYGCISPSGIACTLIEDEYPFFELPRNSVEKIN